MAIQVKELIETNMYLGILGFYSIWYLWSLIKFFFILLGY